jgi:hypothetical protein
LDKIQKYRNTSRYSDDHPVDPVESFLEFIPVLLTEIEFVTFRIDQDPISHHVGDGIGDDIGGQRQILADLRRLSRLRRKSFGCFKRINNKSSGGFPRIGSVAHCFPFLVVSNCCLKAEPIKRAICANDQSDASNLLSFELYDNNAEGARRYFTQIGRMKIQ